MAASAKSGAGAGATGKQPHTDAKQKSGGAGPAISSTAANAAAKVASASLHAAAAVMNAKTGSGPSGGGAGAAGGSAAGAAAAVSANGKWNCTVCTLENEKSAAKCHVCGAVRILCFVMCFAFHCTLCG